MTASLLPIPKLQFFSNTGVPLAGGMVYAYQAGTLIALPTYTDSTGITLNPWPVVLDSAGRANIWVNAVCKIGVYDALGTLLYVVDNIPFLSSNQGLQTTDSPTFANITISGLATVSGFKMVTGAVLGYLLTSDALGNGSWQPPSSSGGVDILQTQVFL